KGPLYRRTALRGARLYAVEPRAHPHLSPRGLQGSGEGVGREEAEGVAEAEAAGGAHLFAPAGAGAVAVGAVGGVPAGAGDDREDVFAVGVDADPGAAATPAPAHWEAVGRQAHAPGGAGHTSRGVVLGRPNSAAIRPPCVLPPLGPALASPARLP